MKSSTEPPSGTNSPNGETNRPHDATNPGERARIRRRDGTPRGKDRLQIPGAWTFRSTSVARNFDAHVREQLPWYELATAAVAHFARHYIPKGGNVYDIGASTGNVGNAIRDVIELRKATFTAVEESPEMATRYVGPSRLVVADAVTFDFEPFDFAVAFLVFMFLPVSTRAHFLRRLLEKTKPGGALVIVDKIQTPPGYVGTAFARLALTHKLAAGAHPEAILRKELSLAGYQRPFSPDLLPAEARAFFQMGEFVGWIIEAPEA